MPKLGKRVRCIHVVLNSKDRVSGTSTDFTLVLGDGDNELKNVIAIRPLRFEYYEDSGTLISSLVINGQSLPIIASASQGAFMYLNGWSRVRTTSAISRIPVFHRLINGVEVIPGMGSIAQTICDSYTYVLRPYQPRLNRFDIKLFDLDQKPLATNPTVLIYLAVYCQDI